jgi:cytochrome b
MRFRTPAREFAFLLFFHATISGAFLVAYLTGDEDTYGLHVVAGYAVLVALALRLLAAIGARDGSVLRLPRPSRAAIGDWVRRLLRGEARARKQRSPLFALMAAMLLIGTALAAASGAAADFIVRLEDLHEALGEIALWLVLGHVAVVVMLHLLRRWTRAGRPALAAGVIAERVPAR